MRISIVVAVSENGVIGTDNQLPWRLPDDLKHFKTLTMGKAIIMGRKTFESIGKPLPGRHNIVISRTPGLELPGCTVATSIDAALQAAGDVSEVVLGGGGNLYAQMMDRVEVIHLTRVHTVIAGDVKFPVLDPKKWVLESEEFHPADERHPHAFTFQTLVRRAS